MNIDDAVKLARELGIDAVHSWGKPTPGVELIERFFQAAYDAGAAIEREACVKVCLDKKRGYEQRAEQPADIRDIDPQSARILGLACEFLAAAIRARGQDPMPLFDDWGGIPYKSCPPCNQQCNQGRDCPNA